MLPEPYVAFPGHAKTAADFTVGDGVFISADQGVRDGVVTKVARTRISVRHPRNQKGDMVERAYPMDRVVVGQFHDLSGWSLVNATGALMGWGQTTPHGRIPAITEPKATYVSDKR